MKIHEDLSKINQDPYGYASKLQHEKKIVGTVCSYVPEEIILAAGATPFRLFGTAAKTRLADAHLQSYGCSLARGILEDALAGKLDFLEGVVFTHTCDTMQRLSDIWRINVRSVFHLDVILPVKLDTESARAYYRDVLQTFRVELGEKLGVAISDDDIRRAIALSNRIRRAFARIYDVTASNLGILQGEELWMLDRAGMMMERNRFADLMEETANKLSADATNHPGASASKRIFLEGGVCNYPDIFSIIEESGGVAVGDDLCTGFRYFSGLVDETNADPIGAIADRYIRRISCPAKHQGTTVRGERLVEMARERQAQGVVFFLLKFCDPHAFDYPYLRDTLEKAGIPSLMVEVDDPLQGEGQLRTRLEAFMEML